MRNLKYLFILIALIFVSCHKDNGNYDYVENNDISVIGINETYSMQAGEYLEISPDVLESDKYTYTWCFWVNGKLQDTISTEKDLNWRVPSNNNNLNLHFNVRSKALGYTKTFTTELQLKDSYSEGWFVLKEIEGMTDMDYFDYDINDSNLRLKQEDVIKFSFGERMKGKPKMLGLFPKYHQYLGSHVFTPLLFPSSDEDAYIINANNLTYFREDSYKSHFYFCDHEPKDLLFATTGYQNFWMGTKNNIFPVSGGTTANLDARVGAPYNYGEMEYEFSEHYCVMSYNLLIAFNLKNNSFVGGIAFGSGTLRSYIFDKPSTQTLHPEANNLSCYPVFLGSYNNSAGTAPSLSSATRAVAIMEDEEKMVDGKKERYYYLFQSLFYLRNMKNTAPVQYRRAIDPKFKIYDVNDKSKITIHRRIAWLYYGLENELYWGRSYSTTTPWEEKLIHTFPADEEITYVKDYYWLEPTATAKFEYLIVATHNASSDTYKVYMYQKDGQGIDENEVFSFEGKGRVKDLRYLSPEMSYVKTEQYTY